MISAILLAGGSGKRFSSTLPKQFLKIPSSGQEVILFSLASLMESPLIDEIVIVVDPCYQNFFDGISFSKPISFALPGKTRQESMISGLKHTKKNGEFILVHDAARPFLDEEDLENTIKAALIHKAAALGVKVKSTIKEVSSDLMVIKTLPRDSLIEIQTPQVISKKILLEGIALLEKEQKEVTDDVSIVEYLQYPVKVVLGKAYNLKITTEEDMKIADTFYLEKRFPCLLTR